MSGACGAGLLAYFVYHVHYLAFVKFDYGYNMKASVTISKYMLIYLDMTFNIISVARKDMTFVITVKPLKSGPPPNNG